MEFTSARRFSLPDWRNLRSWNPKNLRNVTTTFFVDRSKNRWTQQRARRSVCRQEIWAKIKTSCSAVESDIQDLIAVRVFYFKRVRETDQMYFNTSLGCMRREHKYIFFLFTHTASGERSWNEVRIISSVVFDAMPSANYFPPCNNTRNTLCCEPDTANRFIAPFVINIAEAGKCFHVSRWSKCLFTN